MEYKVGYERIPENFYRRRYTDYGTLAMSMDITAYSHPETLRYVLSIGTSSRIFD